MAEVSVLIILWINMDSLSPELNPLWIDLYKQRMDSSLKDKLDCVVPFFPGRERVGGLRVVSIGAGTGKLEGALVWGGVGKVWAVDYAMPMIETIEAEAKEINNHPNGHNGELIPAVASAGNLPFEDGSMDVVIASSVIHEVATFGDGRQFGNQVKSCFREAGRVLKPGGRLIVRDFMSEDNLPETVELLIGKAVQPGDADPVEFLRLFENEYQGEDIPNLRVRIGNGEGIRHGDKIRLGMTEALEIMIHYSWAKRLEDEARERYFYLPVGVYKQTVGQWMAEAGVGIKVIEASVHRQAGYAEHIDGRLDMLTLNGQKYQIPGVTGLVVLERI